MVNETVTRSSVLPSAFKSILYGQSKNVEIAIIKSYVMIKITIQDFFVDSIFRDLEQGLK